MDIDALRKLPLLRVDFRGVHAHVKRAFRHHDGQGFVGPSGQGDGLAHGQIIIRRYFQPDPLGRQSREGAFPLRVGPFDDFLNRHDRALHRTGRFIRDDDRQIVGCLFRFRNGLVAGAGNHSRQSHKNNKSDILKNLFHTTVLTVKGCKDNEKTRGSASPSCSREALRRERFAPISFRVTCWSTAAGSFLAIIVPRDVLSDCAKYKESVKVVIGSKNES